MERTRTASAVLMVFLLSPACSLLFSNETQAVDAGVSDAWASPDAVPGYIQIPTPLVRYRISAADCPNSNHGSATADCLELIDDSQGAALNMVLDYDSVDGPPLVVSPTWTSDDGAFGLQFKERMGSAGAEYIIDPTDKLATNLHGSPTMTIEMKYRFTADCASSMNELEPLYSRLIELANSPSQPGPMQGSVMQAIYLDKDGEEEYLTWAITSDTDAPWARMRRGIPCQATAIPIVSHWVLDLREGAAFYTRAYEDGAEVDLITFTGDSEPTKGTVVLTTEAAPDAGPPTATEFHIANTFFSHFKNDFVIYSLSIYTEALSGGEVACQAAALALADDFDLQTPPDECLRDSE